MTKVAIVTIQLNALENIYGFVLNTCLDQSISLRLLPPEYAPGHIHFFWFDHSKFLFPYSIVCIVPKEGPSAVVLLPKEPLHRIHWALNYIYIYIFFLFQVGREFIWAPKVLGNLCLI